ncbi:MAG: RNA-binding protein, partial [Bacteroidota bacterium]
MNIFVAKLDYETSSEQIQSLFEQYGEVENVKLIIDQETGRSKGYGFIEMPNDEEGEAAVEGLNGSEVDGREIVVKKSEPREQRGGGGYDRGGRGGYGGGGGRGGYDRGGRGGYGGGGGRGGY